jgi:hypothetical protein
MPKNINDIEIESYLLTNTTAAGFEMQELANCGSEGSFLNEFSRLQKSWRLAT